MFMIEISLVSLLPESKQEKHALVFLSQKSTRLEKMAEKMCKKGKIVFTLSHDQILTQLELLESIKPKASKPKASKPDHTLGKGKEHLLVASIPILLPSPLTGDAKSK